MSKRRRLTAEEVDLWRRAMRSTDPLPGRALPPAPSEQTGTPSPAPQTKPQAPPPAQTRRGEPSAAKWHGVDSGTARKIRRGRMDVEAKIDLHGMRQAEAHQALNRFIHSAVTRGRRCVLVITGKGGRVRTRAEDAAFMRSESTGDGILRRQVPLWLAQEPLGSRIFAVEPAHQKDGGGGAFYVFLRRSRS